MRLERAITARGGDPAGRRVPTAVVAWDRCERSPSANPGIDMQVRCAAGLIWVDVPSKTVFASVEGRATVTISGDTSSDLEMQARARAVGEALASTRDQLEAWSQEVSERTPESATDTPVKQVKPPPRKGKQVADDEPQFFKRRLEDDDAAD